jgi:hypothetical protein
MDYAQSRRVKLWGTARAVEDDPALIDQLRDPSYQHNNSTRSTYIGN